MTKTEVSTDQVITQIISIIEDNKGLDVKLLDLRHLENSICDYFIVCSGTSSTHVEALASHIEKELSKNLKEKPWHVEGSDNSEWILLDYVNVLVHVFQQATREYYDIEGLWGDAVITNFSETN